MTDCQALFAAHDIRTKKSAFIADSLHRAPATRAGYDGCEWFYDLWTVLVPFVRPLRLVFPPKAKKSMKVMWPFECPKNAEKGIKGFAIRKKYCIFLYGFQ